MLTVLPTLDPSLGLTVVSLHVAVDVPSILQCLFAQEGRRRSDGCRSSSAPEYKQEDEEDGEGGILPTAPHSCARCCIWSLLDLLEGAERLKGQKRHIQRQGQKTDNENQHRGGVEEGADNTITVNNVSSGNASSSSSASISSLTIEVIPPRLWSSGGFLLPVFLPSVRQDSDGTNTYLPTPTRLLQQEQQQHHQHHRHQAGHEQQCLHAFLQALACRYPQALQRPLRTLTIRGWSFAAVQQPQQSPPHHHHLPHHPMLPRPGEDHGIEAVGAAAAAEVASTGCTWLEKGDSAVGVGALFPQLERLCLSRFPTVVHPSFFPAPFIRRGGGRRRERLNTAGGGGGGGGDVDVDRDDDNGDVEGGDDGGGVFAFLLPLNAFTFTPALLEKDTGTASTSLSSSSGTGNIGGHARLQVLDLSGLWDGLTDLGADLSVDHHHTTTTVRRTNAPKGIGAGGTGEVAVVPLPSLTTLVLARSGIDALSSLCVVPNALRIASQAQPKGGSTGEAQAHGRDAATVVVLHCPALEVLDVSCCFHLRQFDFHGASSVPQSPLASAVLPSALPSYAPVPVSVSQPEVSALHTLIATRSGIRRLDHLRHHHGCQHLRRLYLNGCHHLDEFPPLNSSSLGSNTAANNNSESIILDDDDDAHSSSHPHYAAGAYLHGLEGMPCLELLDAGDSNLKGVQGLRGCHRLTVLIVRLCPQLTLLDGLQGLRRLRVLNAASCCQLRSLSGLRGCSGLRHVHVGWCGQLRSFEGLEDAAGLRTLAAPFATRIVDLRGLHCAGASGGGVHSGGRSSDERRGAGGGALSTGHRHRQLRTLQLQCCSSLTSIDHLVDGGEGHGLPTFRTDNNGSIAKADSSPFGGPSPPPPLLFPFPQLRTIRLTGCSSLRSVARVILPASASASAATRADVPTPSGAPARGADVPNSSPTHTPLPRLRVVDVWGCAASVMAEVEQWRRNRQRNQEYNHHRDQHHAQQQQQQQQQQCHHPPSTLLAHARGLRTSLFGAGGRREGNTTKRGSATDAPTSSHEREQRGGGRGRTGNNNNNAAISSLSLSSSSLSLLSSSSSSSLDIHCYEMTASCFGGGGLARMAAVAGDE